MENNNNHLTALNKSAKPYLTFALLALFYIFACVYVPLALFVSMGQWLSAVLALGICVFAGIALYKMTGSFKPLIGYAVIVGFFAFFGGAFLPMSLLVSFVTSCVVYAYLIKLKQSATVWGLPIIAALLSLLITQSAMGVCLSLLSLPAAFMLALSIKNKVSRVGAVCRISAGICISALLTLATALYNLYGTIDIETVKRLIDSAKEQMSLMLTDMLGELQAILGEIVVSVDSESLVAMLVSSVFNLLPAVLITISNIVAYIIHSLYITSQYSMSEEAHNEAKDMLSFDMSIVSAIIYIAATVLSFVLVSPTAAIYGTVAQNIVLILIPGLVMTALAFVRALSIAKGPSCLGTLLYFVLIFLIAGLNPIVLMAVALAGAVFIILSHIAQYKKEHRKE